MLTRDKVNYCSFNFFFCFIIFSQYLIFNLNVWNIMELFLNIDLKNKFTLIYCYFSIKVIIFLPKISNKFKVYIFMCKQLLPIFKRTLTTDIWTFNTIYCVICRKKRKGKNCEKRKKKENKVMMTDEEERMIWFNGRRMKYSHSFPCVF